MDIDGYLAEVRRLWSTGQATEHSYRPALQTLFRSVDPALDVINEPKKSEGGMPDFLFQRNAISIGWAEAKDIDKDVIRLKGYSVEQRRRYEAAYPNLLYTNGVDFEFIRSGEPVHLVSIADFAPGLPARPDRYGELARQLTLFAEQRPVSIRSAQNLAQRMAAKAAIIKDEIGLALAADAEFRTGLGRQFTTFKENLLPNLTPDEFADIYAETITYGMFAARLHDDTLDTFSRAEALEKLPKSNPFLRGLFQYIAGYDIPDRLRYVVDDLAEVLRASDPHSLFAEFGKFTARNDPFLHFYETFLAAYNPKKRKARGVWYTPEPVVDFIVRAVDDVLKSEFGIADGLADAGKVTVNWDTGETRDGKPVTVKKEVHRVQILDPATGTGTFLAKTVQTVADRVKARAPGKWSAYVEEDLLPRLHGFELLMASYAMCHMKLDMQLTESGYKPGSGTKPADWPAGKQWPPRLSVWLTNALEPAEREVKDLFFQQLADEARGASEVKRQTPIMCVIGNPPYSGESANKGDHIMALMEAYKKEPGGKERLKEHQTRWLLDDYVKFLRMAEETIVRNKGGGVLGFITNHGYLDNPTFRGMRWKLLRSFDTIHVLDLHGNAKKEEVAPGGANDTNVFDIQQGVAIIIAVRHPSHSDGSLAKVYQGDLWGSRSDKYEALWRGSRNNAVSTSIQPDPPSYDFVHRNAELKKAYDQGFAIADMMPLNAAGILTARDALTIDFNRATLWARVQDVASAEPEVSRAKYAVGKDSMSWTMSAARDDLIARNDQSYLTQIAYRPFDMRWTYYTGETKGFYFHPSSKTMVHVANRDNLGMAFTRKIEGSRSFADIAVFDQLITHHSLSIKEVNYFAPLYLYPGEDAAQADTEAPTTRTLNLDPKLYATLCRAAGIDPADTAGPDDDFRAATGDVRPSEVKLFDYIYGVLHSPDYRATYAEFLKIDFPRVPLPANPEVFAHVSKKGEALRRLHLMEPAAIGDAPYPFHGDGDDVVAKGYPKLDGGNVHINPDQWFAGVPAVAWTFHIGGYQPAQKWLKDRRGRSLSFEDISHYQRIVKILTETDRLMSEIELPLAS